MRILIAGATGTVGNYLVPLLVERGHEVFGTTTRADKLDAITVRGATPLLMDGLDAASVSRAVAEAQPDAIIHHMTALKSKSDFKRFDRWFAKTNELRTVGTHNLLDAAALTGTTTRFIAQSYTGWPASDGRTGPITEGEPFDPAPLRQQRATLEAIKRQEDLVLHGPFPGIVLRYANLYSPDSMADGVAMLRKRQFPVVGGGTAVWSWVHARDAALATVAALESGKSGVYNVADDEPAAVSTWLPYLAAVTGSPRPMKVPSWIAKLLIGDAGVRLMTRVRGVSNAKIKRELGWRPTYASWREGFKRIDQRQPMEERVNVPIS